MKKQLMKPKEPKEYKILIWRGEEIYQCRECLYNTSDKLDILDHYFMRHIRKLTHKEIWDELEKQREGE